MRRVNAAMNWLRRLVLRNRFEDEMRDEMNAHIAQEAALQQRRGLNERDAMRAARREFGNVSLLQEHARDAIGTRLLNDTKRDVVLAVRSLARTPGFTLAALLSLTVGIGANTALFSFFSTVWAPPHVRTPATFVSLETRITYPGWQALAARNDLFSTTVVRSQAQVGIVYDAVGAKRAKAELVSDGFFRMYDGNPQFGRALLDGEGTESRGTLPVVLSNRYWRLEFAGDSNVVGRTLRFANGTPLVVVGVMRRGFTGAAARAPDFWLPLSAREFLPDSRRSGASGLAWIADPDETWLSFSAQLAPNENVNRAQLQMNAVLSHLNTADTINSQYIKHSLRTASEGPVSIRTIGSLSVIMLATLCVLLIGCANVANLVLARGARRRREIAVRMSLGATRIRLVRHLMTESVLLAIVGGTAALMLSVVAIRIVSATSIMQTILEGGEDIFAALMTPSTGVVAFTYAIAFVSAAACGLLPALRSTRMDLSNATKDDGRESGNRLSRSKLRTGLIVGQVALSLVLLISASLMAHSANNGAAMEVGFDRDHLATLALSTEADASTTPQRAEFGRLVQEQLIQVLGREHVTRGSIPYRDVHFVRLNLKAAERRNAAVLVASPNYFDVLSIKIQKGRQFTDVETRENADVGVVSETTARRLWPDVDALGQQISIASDVDAPTVDSLRPVRIITVVGVAADAQLIGLGDVPRSLIYLPSDTGSILVRSSGDALKVTALLADAARSVNTNMLVEARTMNDVIAQGSRLLGAQVTAWFAGTLGLLALALSVLGIFGVVAYAVSQRTRELGVRLAIGAQSQDIVRMVVKQGMKPVVAGALLGLFGGALATRAVRAMMFGVTGGDPLSYCAAAFVVCTAALLACYLPARRVTRIDPVSALRSE